MADLIASNVLTEVDLAVQGFSELPAEQHRTTLATIVTKLCTLDLSHVVEIIDFLRKYSKSAHPNPTEVSLLGAQELLRYLDDLNQCASKSGCLLLIYSLANDLANVTADATNLKCSLEFAIKDVVKLITEPLTEELITVAALFDQVSYDALNQLFDEASSACASDRSRLRNVCDFIEHLPCIDQQIRACLVLHRRMLMDSQRLRSGATVLGFRIRKIKRYTDFPRAKYAEELRRLKLKLPEGVYAIVWNYASISAGQFMLPGAKFEHLEEIRSKRVSWIGTATKGAKHEFITADRGVSFVIKNTDSGLLLTEDEGGFCYVEKSEDTWTVDAVRREDEYFYKITNQRTGSSLCAPQEVRLELEGKEDGYNLVDLTERPLVAVQKFELNKSSAKCVVQ